MRQAVARRVAPSEALTLLGAGLIGLVLLGVEPVMRFVDWRNTRRAWW